MLARQHLSAFLLSQLRASVLFLSWFALIVNAHLCTILPLFSTALQALKGYLQVYIEAAKAQKAGLLTSSNGRNYNEVNL